MIYILRGQMSFCYMGMAFVIARLRVMYYTPLVDKIELSIYHNLDSHYIIHAVRTELI